MKKLLRAALLALVPLLGTAGCVVLWDAPVVPPQGLLFTDYVVPLQTDFHQTPVCARKGEASTSYVLIPFFYLNFGWDDAGIEKAKAAGGLQTVEYADYEYLNVLGIYARFTVRAYGN